MYATFFIKFPDANSLSTCLYYLDPDSTLPFSDEVDTDTAELIEWAEELTTLDYSDTSSQDAAYVGFSSGRDRTLLMKFERADRL